MGKEKYLRKIKSLFEKSYVVDAGSIRRIIQDKKRVKQYYKQLIRNLILNGKIKRITKGFYSLSDDPSLAVFAFNPAYLGLQDALSFHNLWEQETIPIIITSKKVRTGMRKISDANVLIRAINGKYLFGIEYKKQGDFYLPVSDIEKTFIDMIYFREKIGGDLLKNFKKKIDIKKLKMYLKKYQYPKEIQGKIFLELK